VSTSPTADRSAIDRTTTHDCAGQAADRAYFAAQGRAMRTCVNCEAAIDVRYVQFSHLCADCRRECTDASDVAPEGCAYCGAALDAPEPAPAAAADDDLTAAEAAMIAAALDEPDVAGLPNLEDTAPTVEILDVTTAYRVKITWLDGFESLIGDWPTRRIARAEAERWIEREQAHHGLPPARG
jgi:hypothetical protein